MKELSVYVALYIGRTYIQFRKPPIGREKWARDGKRSGEKGEVSFLSVGVFLSAVRPSLLSKGRKRPK